MKVRRQSIGLSKSQMALCMSDGSNVSLLWCMGVNDSENTLTIEFMVTINNDQFCVHVNLFHLN
jgi:hypothetical protein